VSGSTEAQRVQDAIHATLRQVADLEEIVGVDIRGISLTTTPLAIVHGLGRAPIGWRAIRTAPRGMTGRSVSGSRRAR
jgi:hypothetical protein